MIKALNTAATGMESQQKNVDNIANNIANVNTTAFKKNRTEFEDLLYQTYEEAGARSSNNTEYTVGNQVGSGSKVAAVKKDHSQGDPKITNNAYDLMVQGDGFFGVIQPNGSIGYTRDGSFNVDAAGNVVTKNGLRLYPGITVPAGTSHLNVTNDGKVEAFVNGQKDPTEIGQIPVFTFVNPVGLKSIGGNLLAETRGSGNATQNIPGQNSSGIIQQGMLETSNVSVMNEMTDLIKAQRAYEMNSKVMGIADQMLQTVNNIR
ncbi:MAG: flagellar basal-body rod protein FlgG [Halobacteriovoraceae bacterium]|nr:flagellar basal-body rod protein FlgG [Halobacteriovoraceae bacterium]